ncbi:terminase gpA endonuclease subunit [Pantoea sp. App145]|uniref:terminase gpA endonuclease subunit n=1 Tax=Pantoea sp. App145 TaxID=3071567 RepID=UPI003A7FD94B
MARAETVSCRTVTDGVHFLVATMDVQGGKNKRSVVQVVGYGAHGERWIVDRYNIRQSLRCGPDGESLVIDLAANPEDWNLLRPDVLDKYWVMSTGSSIPMFVMEMSDRLRRRGCGN